MQEDAEEQASHEGQMGVAELLSLLDRIPIWPHLKEGLDRIDTLEKRLAALEGKPTPAICASCGQGFMRRQIDKTSASAPRKKVRVYRCDKCGFVKRVNEL